MRDLIIKLVACKDGIVSLAAGVLELVHPPMDVDIGDMSLVSLWGKE